MDPKKTSAVALTALLAGAGIGRATVPSPPAPKLERVCVEADGSAQVYADDDGRKLQVLIAPNHALQVQTRDGKKIADVVPPKLSAAIKSILAEAGEIATKAGAK